MIVARSLPQWRSPSLGASAGLTLVRPLTPIEQLLAEGYRPTRTLYLAYGADEEVGGSRGAAQIAALLASRQVRLDFVIDEGLLVLHGVMPGIQKSTAIIGVAEKGNLTVRMKVSGTPGHSSMPPAKGEGVIAMMSAALKQLDDHPLPGGIQGVQCRGVFNQQPQPDPLA